MNTQAQPTIDLQALTRILDPEALLIIFCLVSMTWLFYRFFLRQVSEERHRNIQIAFRSLRNSFITFLVSFLLFHLTINLTLFPIASRSLAPYLGVLSFVLGSIVLVKGFRLFVLQYLFLGSMVHGVPLLIVNIVSLVLTILIAIFGLSRIFGLQLAPLLATSAAFSIILGLALQDTLGNLFAGIALQLDKSFEIGDWLEIMVESTKVIGQVKEISWRSTTLTGFEDEIVVVPNRIMAQAQISNFSSKENPILRYQSFRIEYGSNIDLAIELLERAASEIHEVRGVPQPLAYVRDSNENGILIRLIYHIESYGHHLLIGGKVLRRGLQLLQQNGFSIVRQKIQIQDEKAREI